MFIMTTSRLPASNVLVLLLVGVTSVVLLMYLHMAKEVYTRMNYIETHCGGSGGGGMMNNKGLDLESLVVLYSRVHKTGSTSFSRLALGLSSKNNFSAIHVPTTKEDFVFSVTNQMQFVYKVSNWDEVKPAFYMVPYAYLDFNRFGAKIQPLYIGIIRKPLDRLVSWYNVNRYGEDFTPKHVYPKMGNNMTLDECVALQHEDCSPTKLWRQIPSFCGHYAECWSSCGTSFFQCFNPTPDCLAIRDGTMTWNVEVQAEGALSGDDRTAIFEKRAHCKAAMFSRPRHGCF